MVVFSLQTFINTFFYVQSSGRARRAAPTGRLLPDGGSEQLLADDHSAPQLEGLSARPSASRGYQLPLDGLAIHPVKKAVIRGGPWMPDVWTHDNLVW
jgi:hypothetical protein